MSQTDSPVGPESKRTLAAIVFTDVANFSALMEKNEERTLRLVRRDLGLIQKICEKLGGKALKSTGDGLLMSFDSAVQAAACALQTQQKLGEQARSVKPEDVLMHRIGIHLGDVFISENDVMGDGVNVAARIQTEAPPGGICISQTVYDVVKNRLGVKATYLGPRELKNIKEAVPVYRIILDAHGAAVVPRAALLRRRWVIWACGGGLVIVAGLVALLWIAPWRRKPAEGDLRTPAGAAAAGISATQPVEPKVPQALVDAARRQALGTRNFTSMLKWLEEKDLKDTPLYERYSQMKILQVWLPACLRNVSEDKPLVLRARLAGRPARRVIKVWTSDGEGDLVIEEAGRRREADIKDIEPPLMAHMALALTKAQPASNPRIGMAVRLYISECRELGLIPEQFP